MTPADPVALSTLISGRGSTYGLLARLYRVEVDQALVDQVRNLDLSADVEGSEIGGGYRMLKHSIDGLDDTLLDLAVDYARIFIGAGLERGEAAYPYESVYTSPDRLVMQEARDQVVALYAELDLARSREVTEPEDHIAPEFEYMAFLCQKATEAMRAGDRVAAAALLAKQKAFYETHLARWVPAFCQDVERLARTDFYRAVARITASYLDMERDLIGELVDELGGS